MGINTAQTVGPQAAIERFGAFRVLFLMAAKAEYGENLQALFTPAFIGVGPVEAAVSTTAILSDLAAQNTPAADTAKTAPVSAPAGTNLPDLVVSLGSAGSATLEQTEIYQVSSVSWRDIDASALGVAKGVTPFLDLPAELPMPVFSPQLPAARLSTGGNVISGNDYQSIDADMVDMETYAVLRACQRFCVPVVGLRGISDGRDDLHHIDDWRQYLHIVDEKLAQAVLSLKMQLEQQADLAFLQKSL